MNGPAGLLVSIDGPGGAGKSTVTALAAELLTSRGVAVHGTNEPSPTPLGKLIRAGTDEYTGMALACLVAGDRHHHLAEVKYRVDDLEGVLAALKSRGIEVSDPVHQDDQACAPAGWQFGDSKLGVSFLRLRTVASRHYFTLKQPVDNDQACLEHETEVADRDAMHHSVLHIGYRPTVRQESSPAAPEAPLT